MIFVLYLHIINFLEKAFMKKVVFILSAIASFGLFSCKSVSNNANDTQTQLKLKGDWTLTRVSVSDSYKVKPFHIAEASCFEGSVWQFVPNNNKGTLKMSASGKYCPEFTANFVWNIKKDGTYQMKFVDKEQKAKEVKEGYSMYLYDVTKESFKLIDNSTEATITYTFVKNNK